MYKQTESTAEAASCNFLWQIQFNLYAECSIWMCLHSASSQQFHVIDVLIYRLWTTMNINWCLLSRKKYWQNPCKWFKNLPRFCDMFRTWGYFLHSPLKWHETWRHLEDSFPDRWQTTSGWRCGEDGRGRMWSSWTRTTGATGRWNASGRESKTCLRNIQS